MACNSDHQRPSQRELESVRVCSLIVFVLGHYGRDVPVSIRRRADSCYGDMQYLDEDTARLCALCAKVDDSFIYNGRDANARRLATWWDDHQAADRKREQQEASRLAHAKVVVSARNKLTPQELAALGV